MGKSKSWNVRERKRKEHGEKTADAASRYLHGCHIILLRARPAARTTGRTVRSKLLQTERGARYQGTSDRDRCFGRRRRCFVDDRVLWCRRRRTAPPATTVAIHYAAASEGGPGTLLLSLLLWLLLFFEYRQQNGLIFDQHAIGRSDACAEWKPVPSANVGSVWRPSRVLHGVVTTCFCCTVPHRPQCARVTRPEDVPARDVSHSGSARYFLFFFYLVFLLVRATCRHFENVFYRWHVRRGQSFGAVFNRTRSSRDASTTYDRILVARRNRVVQNGLAETRRRRENRRRRDAATCVPPLAVKPRQRSTDGFRKNLGNAHWRRFEIP